LKLEKDINKKFTIINSISMEFKHGGDVKSFAEANGFTLDEVIDLSSNINFIKPKLDIDFNSLNISSYPNYDILKESLATCYLVDSSQIELFNGGSVAIYSLFRELNLKNIYLYAPLYLEYKRCAILNGYNLYYINRFQNIYSSIKEDSLVVFVNPSTPDGKFYNIDILMQMWMEKRATILIDESFLDFTDFKSAIEYLNKYSKLYILKSMTKFYSSAGIRMGIVISNRENIEQLRIKEPLWKISEFDTQYIQSALKDVDFMEKVKDINSKNRDRVIEILKGVNFIEKIYPSVANFILVKLKNIKAEQFQGLLTPYKIMVRECSNFDFLDNRFIRIAIKDKVAIDRLEEALCKISI